MKLPLKWCVKPSENNKTECDIVRTWFNTKRNKAYSEGHEYDYYWHYPSYSEIGQEYCYTNIIRGYTEITFEQFKKYIMNKIDYTIPGTKLPNLKPEVYFITSNEKTPRQFSAYWDYKDLISYGSVTIDNILYIKCELLNYLGQNHYLVKLSDILSSEIIGYKLVKPEYKMAACKIAGVRNFELLHNDYSFEFESEVANLLQQVNVLDLWFEPVYKTTYEESLKIGDYIYFINSFDGKSSGYVGKIAEINPESNIISNGWVIYNDLLTNNRGGFRLKKANGRGFALGVDFRLATPEEIVNASTKTISMNGKFDLTVKNKRVYHKNEDITNYVKKVGCDWGGLIGTHSIKDLDFKVEDILISKTGCENQQTKLSDWLKVYNLIK